ncbi:transmembrane protein, putative, partial (macronuclear) [Tetrahymena thermophila SB210]
KSECSFLISIQEQQNLIEEQANVAVKQKEIQTINGISLINQENQLIYFYIQVPTTDIQNTFLQISQQKNSQYVIAPYDVDNNFIALSNDTFLTLGLQILQFTNFSLTFQNNTDLLINITQNKITQQIIFQNMDIDFACFGTNQIYISGIEKVIFQNIKISQLNLKECSQQNQQNSLFYFYNVSEIYIYNLEISNNNFYQKSQISIFQFELIKTILIDGVTMIQNINLNSLMSFQQVQNLTLYNLTIKDNIQSIQVKQVSGLFSFYGCNTITLTKCLFQFNNQLVLIFSTNEYSIQNKIIELNDDILFLNSFKVELNKFLQQQIMNIQSSKVQFNNFTQFQNEGSLLLTKSQVIIIEKGHFKLNTAQNGGAIHFLAIKTKIYIKESLFQQNTANSSGGALYLENIDNCIIQFDTMTMIKNNKALIGGGLRIVQTNQKKLLLPQNFPFSNNIFENKAEIYGDDSTSYLQNIIIKNNDNTNEESFTFYQHQSSVPKKFQNDYSRYAELRQFRSGGLINFKMYIVDEQNRYLSFSNEKLILGLYPKDIDQELNTIQISIYQLNSTESQMFGQNTINYFQYNSLDYSFEMNEITVIGNLNKVQFFYINSTIQTNSLTKQPILLSIEFRNCKLGEVIQQVNNNIFQCNQCLKGTYQLVDPQTLYQQSIQQNKDINKCINCPQSALMCKGDIIELKNGFWRHNNYTDEIIECDPIINSCQAENPNSINYCKAGYLGPICLQCDILGEVWQGYRYSQSLSKGFCDICGSQLKQWGFMLLKIVILEAYFLYALGVFIQKFKHSQTCYYLRMLKIMPISSNSINDYSGFYIKIILTYYQLSALLIPQPKIISVHFNLFNDVIGSGGIQVSLGIDCLMSENIIRGIGKILYFMLTQFFVPMVFLLFIPITLMFYQDISKQKIRKYHIYLIFHIIFVFFQVNQISYFIQSLTCKQVGNKLYNSLDLSFDCYDSNVIKYLYPFSVMVLIFWTLLPLAFLKLINLNKKKLNQCLTKYKYGYYYAELKDKFYYWEFVRIYLKITIIYVYTLLNNSNNQEIAIVTISIVLFFYIKIVSQNNPFISINIQQCEKAAYSLIFLKIYLRFIQIQIPSAQIFIEISQIIVDYFFIFCYLIIVLGIMISNSTSKYVIIFKKCLSKIMPQKLKKMINFNKVSFKTYLKWKRVLKKFKKSYKLFQKTIKQQVKHNKQLKQTKFDFKKVNQNNVLTILEDKNKYLSYQSYKNSQQLLLKDYAKQPEI